jgi:hypothetical protein
VRSASINSSIYRMPHDVIPVNRTCRRPRDNGSYLMIGRGPLLERLKSEDSGEYLLQGLAATRAGRAGRVRSGPSERKRHDGSSRGPGRTQPGQEVPAYRLIDLQRAGRT